MLQINHLIRRYYNRAAVDDVTLTLDSGKTYALLGPNGSGKTTLMKMIAGLVKPTSGEILLDNEPIGVRSKAKIAYMPTENYFYSHMTIRDAGRYYADFFSDFSLEQYNASLTRMDLEPKDKIRQLSSGMAAKLRLALTLSRDAELMMFDEPLNGVDILTRQQVVDEILRCRETGRTMLLSTHLVDELEPSIDCAIYMLHGKIALMGDRDVLAERGTLTELYLKIYGTEGIDHVQAVKG
ncbi:MAG: ABC transporter ATP-binding protein [Clostridia bacterium]|nr:ABC transporter ATP-binding protein [Clostridia bacterium]